MRVLVAEFITDGGLPSEATPPSLLREGRAMREAAVSDLGAIAGDEVVTLNVGGPGASEKPGFHAALEHALAGCDAALVIAPEFDDHLVRACRTVTAAGVRWLGCTARAIALCGDKWRLYEHFVAAGIPTLPTQLAAVFDSRAWPPPWVVKRRNGAGSLGVRTFADVADSGVIDTSNAIVQPFVTGRAVSIALLVDEAGRATVLPVAEQRLSADGRFTYLGGRLPVEDAEGRIASLAHQVFRGVPGLNGYVGIDVLVPASAPDRPLVVEVNPRLTTSYIGYRALARENLMGRLSTGTRTPIVWRPGPVAFDSAGTVTREP